MKQTRTAELATPHHSPASNSQMLQPHMRTGQVRGVWGCVIWPVVFAARVWRAGLCRPAARLDGPGWSRQDRGRPYKGRHTSAWATTPRWGMIRKVIPCARRAGRPRTMPDAKNRQGSHSLLTQRCDSPNFRLDPGPQSHRHPLRMRNRSCGGPRIRSSPGWIVPAPQHRKHGGAPPDILLAVDSGKLKRL